MAEPLATYLQDHLAGAKFAVSMLADLRDGANKRLAAVAAELLPEIEEDRESLQEFVGSLGVSENGPKEAAAWFAQKASRLKLDVDDELGAFEQVELLCLGILGKVALWNALKAVARDDERVARLPLDRLTERALAQHDRAEHLRRELAPRALARPRDE